ncbi:MIP/aquaporin family protein [Arthrobacter zhaoguopingii]|uniref:MIP/aquaporin family protein n=1 Tax=Arthrobacter zhaoguopingii TaxID=2681491 RepID=UPI001357ECEA|nr:aquaporin [Arthrobacter zhaoguopingii]
MARLTAVPGAEQPKSGGWHPAEWGSEFVGTFVLLYTVYLAVAALASPLSPLSGAISSWLRLVLIGLSVGLIAAAVAVSPLGRRSGAHLNPAITIGFWAHGQTHWHDLLGYVAAQFLGAALASVVFAASTGPLAVSIGYARTEPAVGGWAATMVELLLTCALVLTVFFMLSSRRTCRWTPAAVTLVLVVLIPLGAPLTGPSLNPARSVGPGIVTGTFTSIWPYLAGPVLGALLAAALFHVVAAGKKAITAKLFHDPRYHSVHTSRWDGIKSS